MYKNNSNEYRGKIIYKLIRKFNIGNIKTYIETLNYNFTSR